MNKFKWVLAFSALFIAGCAAFFSVSGIATLFSGSLVGVAIMAASLEIGKLVSASYLHRNWKTLSKFFKIYLTSAVIILVFITSLGIFGYLSNAYQKTALRVDQVEGRIELLQTKQNGFEQDIARNIQRVDVLTNQRQSQETRYDSLTAGEHWVNARRTYNLIESADTEISTLNSQINAKRDSVNRIQTEILEIRNDNLDLSREIGGFKFVADAFDVDIDTAVKWFILILIFVFDPLAVSLVVAYSAYTEEGFIEFKEKVKEKIKNKPDGLGVVSDKAQKQPNEKKNM